MNIGLIIGITFVALIAVVFGIIKMIPWRAVFEKHFGNNPQKARIFILIGEQEQPVNGNFVHADEDGYFYYYKWNKVFYQVFVPAKYPWRFLHGRRRINVVAGQAEASPLGDEKYSGSGEALNTMIGSKIAIQLVRSVSGSKAVPWVIIIIVAVALIGGYFVMKNFMGKGEATPTPTPTITPTPFERPTTYEINGWSIEYVS